MLKVALLLAAVGFLATILPLTSESWARQNQQHARAAARNANAYFYRPPAVSRHATRTPSARGLTSQDFVAINGAGP